MLIKNLIYEAEVGDYTSEGQGIAKIEGCAVFIPNAIVGEKLKVRIERVHKSWASGKIVEVLERSPHRVNRECPVAKLCGGCDFWHMDYEEESRLKANRVKIASTAWVAKIWRKCPFWRRPPATVTATRLSIRFPAKRVRRMRAFSGREPMTWWKISVA
jgi:tRNA/tmRNA/rRNA uracil-C5-methylase (TrmA/RlmC/RlmD family)